MPSLDAASERLYRKINSADGSVTEAQLSILTRHPMRESDLLTTLEKWLPGQAESTLQQMSTEGKIQLVKRRGQRFWSMAQAKYRPNQVEV